MLHRYHGQLVPSAVVDSWTEWRLSHVTEKKVRRDMQDRATSATSRRFLESSIAFPSLSIRFFLIIMPAGIRCQAVSSLFVSPYPYSVDIISGV